MVEKTGGRIIFARTASRFVTGTGINNPVEIGFTWHSTLGVPYLPGSSLKGLVRVWGSLEDGKESKEWVNDDFGSRESGSGDIIFFDALPLRPVKLAVDVMTPHYRQYYQGSAPPGDWQAPVPIPFLTFLTVEANQSFMFAFAPRPGKEVSDQHLDKIEGLVIQALDFEGAGAKTAVGYGRFVIDEVEADRYRCRREAILEEESLKHQLAQMSPLRCELETDGYDDESFISKMDSWIERAEKAEGADRHEIAQALQAWYEKYRPGFFESPNKKNKVRVDRIKVLLEQ